MFSANQMNSATPAKAARSGMRIVRRSRRTVIVVRNHSRTTAARRNHRRSRIQWWVKKFA